MFIELLNGALLNMFILQNAFINPNDNKKVSYLLTNGTTLDEDCGDSNTANSRLATVKSIMTGHLEELKTQVTQLETTVTDASINLDSINGEIV